MRIINDKRILVVFFTLWASLTMAQELIKGRVIDDVTEEPIPGVIVTVVGLDFDAETDAQGYFVISGNVPVGDQKLSIIFNGYYTKIIPIVVSLEQVVNIDPLYLVQDNAEVSQSQGVISLTENDLADDENAANNISGLLQATRDQFLRAAAFDFSSTFFRPRGLNSEDGKVIINGLEMNKQFSGRPQWSNWGGLNDLQRNQVFTMGLQPADVTFGGYGGVQSIDMRASQQRPGTQISYASSNRSYQGRFMASYRSGLLESGWSYAISASRRAGDEGYFDATLYDANSIGLSVEKKLNDSHSINFTGMYAANRRGRRTAVTQEIVDLKGVEYNPLWGFQNNQQRNSRIREIDEPILMLNHYWDVTDKFRINTNVGYQFGKIGNTRIDNGGTTLREVNGQFSFEGGARNPNPDYYQNLPSYFLRNGSEPIDFQYAYQAEQAFINDGQLDWNALYEANRVTASQGDNALYVIQEDRIDDDQLQANILFSADISDNILFNGGVNYRNLKSENYALVQDELGGNGFLDIDFFSDESAAEVQDQLDAAQSDVNNPNRIVREGDRYKYNYDINAEVYSAFAQGQFKSKYIDYYVAGNVSRTSYQRDGKYENGNFIGNSFGKSEELDFTNFGVKGGATYKINGQNYIDANAAYMTRAPYIRNSFTNARQNNNTTTGLESERSYSGDLSYILRTPSLKMRLTGYYTQFLDGSDIGFYFTEDLTGLPIDDGAAFVQEVVTNIERRNVGVEMGVEYQMTPTFKLKGAAAIGQNTFTNNPDLYLTSDDFDGELRFGDGTVALEDYHVAGGPETALQLGFEYRDPEYWNVGVTANYFANGYIDVSNLRRSANFIQDYDAQVFNDYDPAVANELLRQEQFDDYLIWNAVGGKSWKIGDKYIGFFAVVNNIFDIEYKTGGFEQSRNSNFRSVRDDQNNPTEVFAPRYFFGNGATYYVNVYLRF
ncbi:TonB-dependent receptor [Nonlabens spongiae]|uniref:TonB-dependent receptor n=2 Tax=Nonlabens spongiae TaxID=331648 RepID=A0A1W6MMG2_9FLAO|nr:TonB-dependent receptor [Nonlabens spongiae]